MKMWHLPQKTEAQYCDAVVEPQTEQIPQHLTWSSYTWQVYDSIPLFLALSGKAVTLPQLQEYYLAWALSPTIISHKHLFSCHSMILQWIMIHFYVLQIHFTYENTSKNARCHTMYPLGGCQNFRETCCYHLHWQPPTRLHGVTAQNTIFKKILFCINFSCVNR
jgi:hypothetical protein